MFSQSWNFDAIPKNDYVWEWWPFKDIANNNDDAVGELQFDLIELCEVNPELALGDLDADGLINIDVRTLTNSARPLAEKENVNEYSDKPPAEVADGESNDDENDDDDDSITWTTPPYTQWYWWGNQNVNQTKPIYRWCRVWSIAVKISS